MKQNRVITNVSCLSNSQELWQQSSSSSREGTPKLFHASELPENVNSNRKINLKTFESDAIREASYIGSFPVDETSQEARAEYIKKHLLNMKVTSPAKPVLLLISLSGIKVCCGSGETVFMSHAIKRISYATCQSEKRRFSFLAREPKSASNVQYCHTFATKKPGQAEELNNIVANAFKIAYQQQQQQNNNNNEHLQSTTSFNDLIKAQIQQQQIDSKMADKEKQKLLSNQLLCISTSNIDNLCQQRKDRRESYGDLDESTLAWARRMVQELLQSEATQGNTSFDNTNNNIDNIHHNNDLSTSNHLTNHHLHPDPRPLHHFFSKLSKTSTSPVVSIMDFIDETFTCVFGGISHQPHMPPDLTSVQTQAWSTNLKPQHPITTSVSMVSMATEAKKWKKPEGHLENFTREYFNKNGRGDELNDSKLQEAVWYQPGVPRDVALNHLLKQPDGSFIVRDSSTHPGCYALSIKVPKYDSVNEITHYLIVKTTRDTFKIKGLTKEWTSLTSLVLHHTIMRELLPCLLVLPS